MNGVLLVLCGVRTSKYPVAVLDLVPRILFPGMVTPDPASCVCRQRLALDLDIALLFTVVDLLGSS